MTYTIKEKSDLIALLELDHNKQGKLLNPQVKDKRLFLLLDLVKKNKLQNKIVQSIK